MTTLSDLRDRVLAGSGEDWSLDSAIACVLYNINPIADGWCGTEPYTASLDACIALVAEKLPGWTYTAGTYRGEDDIIWPLAGLCSPSNDHFDSYGHVGLPGQSPARALLTVLLTALMKSEHAPSAL